MTDMNPAAYVVGKFGGARKLATLLGLPTSTVQTWKDRVRAIPAHHQARVLAVAAEQGVDLTAQEIIYGNGEPA